MSQTQRQLSTHYHEQLRSMQQALNDQLARKDSAFEELKAHGLRAAAESSNYARLNRGLEEQAAVLRQQVVDLQAQLQDADNEQKQASSAPEHVRVSPFCCMQDLCLLLT